jgi:hypothetical protein
MNVNNNNNDGGQIEGNFINAQNIIIYSQNPFQIEINLLMFSNRRGKC